MTNDNGNALKTWGRPPEAYDGQPRNTRTVMNLSPGEARKFHAVLDNASNPQRVLRLLDIRDAAKDMVRLLTIFSGAPEALQDQADVLAALLDPTQEA